MHRLQCVRPRCPVEAIYADDELPEKWAHYREWNDYLSKQWQQLGYNITEKKDPASGCRGVEGSREVEQDILTWDAGA
jgi:ferredoxin